MALKSITDFTNLIKTYFAKSRQLATVEPATAGHNYAIGEQLILNGELYTAKTAITTGDTLTVGTNIELAPKITTQIGTLNEALTNEVKARQEYNVKNLAVPTENTQTVSSIVFTRNSDDSWTVNGSGSSKYILINKSKAITLKANETYTLSGGYNTNLKLEIVNDANHSWYSDKNGNHVTSTGSATTFTNGSSDKNVYITIRLDNNVSTNATVYPMLCLASDYAISSDYVQATKTNRELTEDVAVLSGKLLMRGYALVTVTADGVKTYKTLAKELADAFISLCQGVTDSNIYINPYQINFDGAGGVAQFTEQNLYLNNTASSLNLGATSFSTSASGLTFIGRGVSTTNSNNNYREISINSSGQVTITDKAETVITSGKKFYLYYTAWSKVV